MKKLMLALAAVFFTLGAAHSADIALKTAPAAVPPPAVYNWSGFYVGGNGGGGWGQTSFTDNSLEGWVDSTFSAMNLGGINNCVLCGIVPGVSPPTAKVDPTGWAAGFQAGWMHQFGNIVLGVEGEWDWTSLKGTATSVASANPNVNLACIQVNVVACIGNVNDAFNVNTKWTADVSTVIGWAADRLLFYGKIGGAWAHNNYTQTASGAFCPITGCPQLGGPFPFTIAGSANETRPGWLVGSGVEWAFANNWSVRVEYDYMNFGTKTVTFFNVASIGGSPPHTVASSPATFNVNVYQAISEVKVGINYRFGSLF